MRLIFHYTLALQLLFVLACRHANLSSLKDDSVSLNGQSPVSAVQAWNTLQEGTATGRPIKLFVSGSDKNLMYGAEKEGSSSLITRLLGPKPDYFREIVVGRSSSNRTDFLVEFLSGLQSGSILEKNVTDAEGNPIVKDFSFLKNYNFKSTAANELVEVFDRWLQAAGERPFSFVNPEYRQRIFLGKAAGLGHKRHFKEYERFIVHHGQGEKYVLDALKDGAWIRDIWEIRFKPQNSYGEFHAMINWFRTTLAKFSNSPDSAEALAEEGVLFDAPGHQRVSFYHKSDGVDPELAKIQEVVRNIQAYIVLSEISGKTGILTSKHKEIYSDQEIATWMEKKGLIRLEKDKFGDKIRSIEFRAGTKTESTRLIVQHWLSTYTASGDFNNITSINKWELIPTDFDQVMTADKIASRFGVSPQVAKKFLNNVKNSYNRIGRFTKFNLTAPIWYWENSPYLSPKKKALVRRLTASFINDIAQRITPRHEDVSDLLSAWAKSSGLRSDIESYLTPVPKADPNLILVKSSGPLDVNKVDLGLEYSARFSISSKNDYTEEEIGDKKRWVKSVYDLTPNEREHSIRDYATLLQRKLFNGEPPKTAPKRIQEGHGHNLSIAYEFSDLMGRTWRVEWDGIGRSYDEKGQIIPGSERGGHVEVVTPKGGNDATEIKHVFDAFTEMNFVPAQRAGGGHISIDLAPFLGKPKQMARFLALFNQYQGMTSFLFQDMNRLRSAAPLDVSPEFQQKLVSFNGTETELKRLLYNERYFNTRSARKTRYSTIDMALYFQDVIPAEYITADYDFNNPTETWRRNFRVNPSIRKMEMRLFDAPRNAHEAYLQIKFVRAMLDYALNTNKPVSDIVQPVDPLRFAASPTRSEDNCKEMMTKLGLKFEEYQPMLNERIVTVDRATRSKEFVPWHVKLEANPKTEGWSEALPVERAPSEALKSSTRNVQNLAEAEKRIVFKDAIDSNYKVDLAREAELARQQALEQDSKIPGKDLIMGPCRRINAEILKIIPIGKMRY